MASSWAVGTAPYVVLNAQESVVRQTRLLRLCCHRVFAVHLEWQQLLASGTLLFVCAMAALVATVLGTRNCLLLV